MRLTKRENFFLIGGLIVILFVIYINYFLIPQIEKINMVRSDIIKLEKDTATLRSYAREINKIDQEIQSTKEQLNTLDAEFPQTKRIAEFLYNLAKIASDSNVRINKANFQDLEEKEKFYILPFKVEIVGNYFDFERFLKNFEKMGRIFTIESIDITKNEDGLIYANLSVKLYIIKGNNKTEPPFIKVSPDYKSIDPFITIKPLSPNTLSSDNTELKDEIERLNNIISGMSQH